jgi:DNA polymerase-3 subunit delta'
VIFPEVIGAEGPRGVLARMLASDRIPHALLFHGPGGVGKRMVAEHFARSVLCESPDAEGAGCGRCTACVKASHGNHPDLLITTRLPKTAAKEGTGADADDEGPEAADSGGDLKAWILVEQIRQLAEHAAYAPREGRRRVFLIDPADHMNAAAQNALLKTLEEPPGRALILLITSRPHVLFPTVRSRCFQLGFAAMDPEALAEALQARGAPLAEARSRAALAEGRPGRAITLDLPVLEARRDAILTMLETLIGAPSGIAGMAEFVAELLGDDEPKTLEGLEMMTALLRDAARSAAGADAILHADVAPRVRRVGRALGLTRAGELAVLSDRMRGELRLTVNKTLLTETLLAAVAGGPVPS